jgi:hypothetical protein
MTFDSARTLRGRSSTIRLRDKTQIYTFNLQEQSEGERTRVTLCNAAIGHCLGDALLRVAQYNKVAQ